MGLLASLEGGGKLGVSVFKKKVRSNIEGFPVMRVFVCMCVRRRQVYLWD